MLLSYCKNSFCYINENFTKLLIKAKIKLRNCFLNSQNLEKTREWINVRFFFLIMSLSIKKKKKKTKLQSNRVASLMSYFISIIDKLLTLFIMLKRLALNILNFTYSRLYNNKYTYIIWTKTYLGLRNIVVYLLFNNLY